MLQEIRNALPKALQERWDKARQRDQQQQQGEKKEQKTDNPPQNP
jgi:hypothetical protein